MVECLCVCVCVCALNFLKNARGELGEDGRERAREGRCSQSKNSSASILLLPPMLPPARPQSLHLIIISLLNEKRLQVHGGGGVEVFLSSPHASFVLSTSGRTWRHKRDGEVGTERLRVLTGCSSLTSTLRMPPRVLST